MKEKDLVSAAHFTFQLPGLKKHRKPPQLNLPKHQPMTDKQKDRQIERQIGILLLFAR